MVCRYTRGVLGGDHHARSGSRVLPICDTLVPAQSLNSTHSPEALKNTPATQVAVVAQLVQQEATELMGECGVLPRVTGCAPLELVRLVMTPTIELHPWLVCMAHRPPVGFGDAGWPG